MIRKIERIKCLDCGLTWSDGGTGISTCMCCGGNNLFVLATIERPPYPKKKKEEEEIETVDAVIID